MPHQFTVRLGSQPTALASLLERLAARGTDVRAIGVSGMGPLSTAVLMTEDDTVAHAVLRATGYPFLHGEVVITTVPDEPGALATLVRHLAESGIILQGLLLLRWHQGKGELALSVNNPATLRRLLAGHAPKAGMMPSPKDNAEVGPTQSIRVLLVEDDDDHALLAQWALGRAGSFAIDRVASGIDALTRAADKEYDALVLDYHLGDMDGLDVLKQLRAAGTSTPALVLTSYGSEEVVAEALRVHADDYLPKKQGLVGDQLGRAVLAMLERQRLTDALSAHGDAGGE